MLTKIKNVDKDTVSVASGDERVTVTVDRDAAGPTLAPLTSREAHDVLVKVQSVTNDFLAAVESDAHATKPNEPR